MAQSFQPNPRPLTKAASFQISPNSGVFLNFLVCLRERAPTPNTYTECSEELGSEVLLTEVKAWCELKHKMTRLLFIV